MVTDILGHCLLSPHPRIWQVKHDVTNGDALAA
jgi:hypothetical protein